MNATRFSPSREILPTLPIVAHASSLCDFKQKNYSCQHRSAGALGAACASCSPKGQTSGLPRVFPRTGVRGAELFPNSTTETMNRTPSPQRNKTMTKILFASLAPTRVALRAAFRRLPRAFPCAGVQLSSFTFQVFLLLLLSACASNQPRSVADRYTSETSSRVLSRGPAPMDDAEARRLASGGQITSTPVKKSTVTSGGRVTQSSEESVTSTTTTETVVGSQAVAAPDAEVSPR